MSDLLRTANGNLTTKSEMLCVKYKNLTTFVSYIAIFTLARKTGQLSIAASSDCFE